MIYGLWWFLIGVLLIYVDKLASLVESWINVREWICQAFIRGHKFLAISVGAVFYSIVIFVILAAIEFLKFALIIFSNCTKIIVVKLAKNTTTHLVSTAIKDLMTWIHIDIIIPFSNIMAVIAPYVVMLVILSFSIPYFKKLNGLSKLYEKEQEKEVELKKEEQKKRQIQRDLNIAYEKRQQKELSRQLKIAKGINAQESEQIKTNQSEINKKQEVLRRERIRSGEECKNLSSEIWKVRQKNQDCKQSLTSTKDASTKKNKELINAKQDLAIQITKVQDIRSAIDFEEDKSKKLKDLLDKIKLDLESVNKRNQNLVTANKGYLKIVKNLKNQNQAESADYTDRISSVRKQITLRREQYQNQVNENNQLVQDLNRITTQIVEYRNNKAQLSLVNNTLQNQLAVLENSNNQLTQQIDDVRLTLLRKHQVSQHNYNENVLDPNLFGIDGQRRR